MCQRLFKYLMFNKSLGRDLTRRNFGYSSIKC